MDELTFYMIQAYCRQVELDISHVDFHKMRKYFLKEYCKFPDKETYNS